MKGIKNFIETGFALGMAFLSFVIGLFFVLAVVAVPFVAIGVGIALAVRAFSWVAGWPV